MRRALRYRRGQALLLAVLAAVITATATFSMLFVDTLDSAAVRARLGEVPAGSRVVQAELFYNDADLRQSDAALRDLIPAEFGRMLGVPVLRERAVLDSGSGAVSLQRWDGACTHLRITAGRCPSGQGEILVPGGARWSVGQDVPLLDRGSPGEAQCCRVVGTYSQPTNDPFWGGARLDQVVVSQTPRSTGPALFTVGSTFTTWPSLKGSQTITFPVVLPRIDTDNVDRAIELAGQAVENPLKPNNSTQIRTPFVELGEQLRRDRGQVRLIAPLLLGQLVVLLLVATGLMLTDAVTQRRPEIALSRLRGAGRRGVRRDLAVQLGLPMASGAVCGVGLGYLTDLAARTTWLPAGLPTPTTAAGIGAAAGCVCLLAVLLWSAIRRGTHDSLGELFRGTARAVPARMGVVDVVVLSGGGAILFTTVSGGMNGPVALLAPTVAALTLSVLVVFAWRSLAVTLGRRALRRGRLSTAVAALSAGRRQVGRRLVTVLVAVVTLAVFAVNIAGAADDTRRARADVEVGAPMRLGVDPAAHRGTALRAAEKVAREVDPTGLEVTPVLRVGNPNQRVTMGVEPRGFSAIALTGTSERFDTSMIQPPIPAPVRFTGNRLHTSIRTSYLRTLMPVGEAGGTWLPSTRKPPPSAAEAARHPRGYPYPTSITRPSLVVDLFPDTGDPTQVVVGRMPDQGDPKATFSSMVPCSSGCRIGAVGLTYQDSDLEVDAAKERYGVLPTQGRVDVEFASATGPLDAVSRVKDWQADAAEPIVVEASGAGLAFSWDDIAKATTPVLVRQRGALPRGGVVVAARTTTEGRVQVPMLGHEDVVPPIVSRPANIPGAAPDSADPSLGEVSVVMSLRNLTTYSSTITDPADIAIELWTSDPSAAQEQRLRAALGRSGVRVLQVQRADERKAVFDASSSAWSLKVSSMTAALALIVGVLVMFMVTAMAWRTVGRDLAALRTAGVPVGALRRAVLIDQGATIIVALVLGVGLALLGSMLVMHRLPLFGSPPTIVLTTGWFAVRPALVVIGVVTVVIVGAAVISVRRLVHSAGHDRLRERQ